MKEIEVDIDELKSPEDVLKVFKKKKVIHPENFTVWCSYHSGVTDIQQFTVLLFINAAFQVLSKQITEGEVGNYITASLADAMAGYSSVWSLESRIENQWKTHIEWKPKERKIEENPLDELFGLWKDRDISPEQIRKNAWPKRN